MTIHRSLSAVCGLVLSAVGSGAAQSTPPARNTTCPTISVSCPAHYNHGDLIVFSANVSGGDPNVIPGYNWEVSAGKITQGQGSWLIKVDMSGFRGQTPTGTVTISGFDSTCPATASCTLAISANAPSSKKFDSYGVLSKSEKAVRLNAFAVQLEQQPGAQGYLLVYGARRSPASEAEEVGRQARDYLVKTRAIAADRIVTVAAGFKENLTVDLWLVPTGANRPVADPTVDPAKVIGNKAARQKSSTQ